jgi:hypothetical protein
VGALSQWQVGACINPIGVSLTGMLTEDSTLMIAFDIHKFTIDGLDNLGVFSQRRVESCINSIGVRLTGALTGDSTLMITFNKHKFKINRLNNLGVFSQWRVEACINPINVRLTDVLTEGSACVNPTGFCWIHVLLTEDFTVVISIGNYPLLSYRGGFAIVRLDNLGAFSERRVVACINPIGVRLNSALTA